MLAAEELLKRFIEKKLTLSLAESITGGAISAQLVQIPDASLYLLGSIVAYSDSAKVHLLDVSPNSLEDFGAVSGKVAQEMAAGARKQFGSDLALSVTGIAGPSGGSLEKPIGTVCFSIAKIGEEPSVWTSHFEGTRAQVIDQTIAEGFKNLLHSLD